MLDSVFGALGQFLPTVASGGLIGLLGTGLTAIASHFQRKQAHRQEVELRRLDMEIAKIEAAGFERVAGIEAEGEAEKAAWSALEESYREGRAALVAAGRRAPVAAGRFLPRHDPAGAHLVSRRDHHGDLFHARIFRPRAQAGDRPHRAFPRHDDGVLVVRRAPCRQADGGRPMSDIELRIVGFIAAAIVAGCVGLFVRMRKAEAAAERLDERVGNLEKRDPGTGPLRERVAAAEQKLARMEATLNALPTAREVSEIGRCVALVQGDVKAVAASLSGMEAMIKGVDRTVGALNSHLLKAAAE